MSHLNDKIRSDCGTVGIVDGSWDDFSMLWIGTLEIPAYVKNRISTINNQHWPEAAFYDLRKDLEVRSLFSKVSIFYTMYALGVKVEIRIGTKRRSTVAFVWSFAGMNESMFLKWTKDDVNYSFEILIWKCSSIIKTFKAFFSTYDLPHASQLNRFANGPACRFKCILRWDLYLNDLSHCVHLNRRLPCVVLRCVTKYRLVLKLPRGGGNEKIISKIRFR